MPRPHMNCPHLFSLCLTSVIKPVLNFTSERFRSAVPSLKIPSFAVTNYLRNLKSSQHISLNYAKTPSNHPWLYGMSRGQVYLMSVETLVFWIRHEVGCAEHFATVTRVLESSCDKHQVDWLLS